MANKNHCHSLCVRSQGSGSSADGPRAVFVHPCRAGLV